MFQSLFFCTILTFSDDDYTILAQEFGNSGVRVQRYLDGQQVSENTIFIGWENVSKIFPEQRISNHQISENVFWVYSLQEDKESLLPTIKKRVQQFLKGYLPELYVAYDAVLDGKLSDFIKQNFIEPFEFLVFFSGKAMYIYNKQNPDTIFGVSLESMRYIGIDVKSAISMFLQKYKPIILSYENVSRYINSEHQLELRTVENLFWSQDYSEIFEREFNDFVMSNDSLYFKYIPFLMSRISKSIVQPDIEKEYTKLLFQKDIITQYLSTRELHFNNDYVNDKIIFKKSLITKFLNIRYSNKRTLTGRINCVDKQFNPQMLPKNDNAREHIISRFGDAGKLVVFDYVSFETKISLYLTRDEKFIEKYKDSDLHSETAKVIFDIEYPTSEQRMIGKKINHALLYGSGDLALLHILAGLHNQEKVLAEVKRFLSPIIEISTQIQESFETLEYLVTSFGSVVRPNKSFAAFNNYVQATAVDMVVQKLWEIKRFLATKKSQFVFQNQDSFVFDVHESEYFIIEELRNLLSVFGELEYQVDVLESNNLDFRRHHELDVCSVEETDFSHQI